MASWLKDVSARVIHRYMEWAIVNNGYPHRRDFLWAQRPIQESKSTIATTSCPLSSATGGGRLSCKLVASPGWCQHVWPWSRQWRHGNEIASGVVVRERGGTPFLQIFWSRNGAPANIVGHRWNANTEAFWQITSYSLGWPSIILFSGPNCPKCGIWHQKSQKISGGGLHPRTPSIGGGEPIPHTPPARRHAVRGAQAPPLLGPRSQKPFSQIKIYHYTPGDR